MKPKACFGLIFIFLNMAYSIVNSAVKEKLTRVEFVEISLTREGIFLLQK